MDTSRKRELTVSIRRDLVEESGSAFSKFAEEIPSTVLNETDLKLSFLNVLSVISILHIRALLDNSIGLETSTASERLSEEVERILDDIESGKEKVTRYDNIDDYLKHLDNESKE